MTTFAEHDLVYHDAIVTAGSGLRTFLHGHAASMRTVGDSNRDQVRRLAALHQRVGLLEMVNHEFLDPNRRKERTTFADGTTVTVDWDAGTVSITPEPELN